MLCFYKVQQSKEIFYTCVKALVLSVYQWLRFSAVAGFLDRQWVSIDNSSKVRISLSFSSFADGALFSVDWMLCRDEWSDIHSVFHQAARVGAVGLCFCVTVCACYGYSWQSALRLSQQLVCVICTVFLLSFNPGYLLLFFRFWLLQKLHQPIRCDRVTRFPWQVPSQFGVHLHHYCPSPHGSHTHLYDLWPGKWPFARVRGRVQIRLAGSVGWPAAGWV